MLNKHIDAARDGTDPPWDAARAARVLHRTLDARRASRRRSAIAWPLALAALPLAALLVHAASGGAGNGPGASPATDPRPAAVGTDALDAGKQTG
jgi:hypothetical protein